MASFDIESDSSVDAVIDIQKDEEVGKNIRELHSSANDSSSSGGPSTFTKNNRETKKSIESNEEEQEQDNLKIMIKSVEKKLKEVSSLRSCYDIYRVPRQLRKQKPEAYTPQSVAIGPLHHNDHNQIQMMETHKLRYLYHLLNRSGKTFEFLVEALSGLEEEAHKSYSDTMSLGKSEFVKMMVIDSCFILEFLEGQRREENDHFISNATWSIDIMMDLIKLENQLPLVSLERLFALKLYSCPEGSFNWFIYKRLIEWSAFMLNGPFLVGAERLESLLSRPVVEGRPQHFLDFLRYVLIPSFPKEIPSRQEYLKLSHNASELKNAGVKFHKYEHACLVYIDFDMKNGILTIPTLKIYDDTEVLLRNLIAFEQEKPLTSRYFSAYATFMDGLIDTASDVTLLMQKGIIINYLGSPEDVATLFNNIVKHVAMTPYFTGVTKDLNEYCGKSLNKWMANLRQTYFNTPWAGISVAAAVLVIILTIIQTIFSILQATN